MALDAGTRFGPYEITAPIGAGGMGEVYRARDTKLNRDVALKVLPQLFAADPERLARFEREAQLLASLNHPNIAHIYGIETGEARVQALVLELVPGPTLADRLTRGPVPLEEARAIARQIADALEAAHEQGVIHRDLKPANIKVRDDGTVKVLDFGLAKAMAPDAASGVNALNSPTMSARATEMGVILGTAAYMSPEQAKGKAADRRADIWAFGVVLFEMIAGKQVFTGETASEVMASVMKEEPDWLLLPANVPPSMRRLLRRCLEKDPKQRLSSISDVKLELSETDSALPEAAAAPVRGSGMRLLAAALGGAAVTAAGFLAVATLLETAPERHASRVSVLSPEGAALYFDAAESAISPDGRSLAFATADPSGATKLWVRLLDSLDAHALTGTDGGRLPFWSPDSRQIAFFADGKLKKMPAAGGTVETVCEARDGRGGAWNAQNIIVFSPANAGPLQSVSANGGEPRAVTSLDASRGETGHRFPWFLPDGRHFLFASLPAKNLKFDIHVGSLDAPDRPLLTTAEGAAVYAEPGYLIFPRDNALVAQPFDARIRQISGDPVAIGDAPGSTGALYSSGRSVSVSTTGTIAYLGDRLPNTRLVWLDRTGREVGTLSVPEGRYQEMSISPDGRRAAVIRFRNQSDSDIWIADVARGGATRFTSTPGLNVSVAWSPDSSRLLFASDREGARDLWVKPASGATPEQRAYGSPILFKDSKSWSPDGKLVSFDQFDPQTNRDIYLLTIDGAKAAPYLRTSFDEWQGIISSDGRSMAYISNESGRPELYVDSFPVPSSKYKVSENGALGASWRQDGRELMIFSAASSVLVSEVRAGATFSTSAPRRLFDLPRGAVYVAPTRDHQRLLVAVPVKENTTSTLTLVFDWVGTLRRK